MRRKLNITKKAEKNFEDIVDYLALYFGETVTNRFIERTSKLCELLVMFPQMGRFEDKKRGIYSFVLEKQVTVFYRFNSKQVIILKFFDTRQDPKKRSK